MVNFNKEIDIENMADNIEPSCNFGYVIAKELRETNSKINDLHKELYQNGYIDDIKQLRQYVEEKQQEHENRIDFRQKAKIAVVGAIAGGVITPIIVWLLGFM